MTKITIDSDSFFSILSNTLSENIELKQQLIEQEKIIKDIQLHDVSKEVYMLMDDWMNRPIPEHLTEQQDMKVFTYKITKFIDNKLRN